MLFQDKSHSHYSWLLAEQHDQNLSNQAQLNGLGRINVQLILVNDAVGTIAVGVCGR